MTIDPKKFEINLNTIISGFTLVSTIALAGYVWANTTRDIDEVKRWQSDHDKTTAERLIENRTVRGQIDERIKAVEKSQAEGDRNKDQIAYRVTVMETSLAAQQQQQQKLGDDVSEMKGDMKVIKDAVLRLDSANKRLGR